MIVIVLEQYPAFPSRDQCVTVDEDLFVSQRAAPRLVRRTILGIRWLAGHLGPPPAEPRINWFRSSVCSNQELPSNTIEARAFALLERGVEGRTLAVVPTKAESLDEASTSENKWCYRVRTYIVKLSTGCSSNVRRREIEEPVRSFWYRRTRL